MSEYEIIILDVIRDGIVILMFNCLDCYNVFNSEVIVELMDVLEMLEEQDMLCMVILCGVGKSFLVGVDLEWMKVVQNWMWEDNEQDVMVFVEMFCKLVELL